jgi:two-component system nitrate/nitrite response regulator NarL
VSEPPSASLRVVIADDHPLYRMGLARSLREHGIDVVAEAPNGYAAIRAVEETAPDVVVTRSWLAPAVTCSRTSPLPR